MLVKTVFYGVGWNNHCKANVILYVVIFTTNITVVLCP